jgi:hypothetical protein
MFCLFAQASAHPHTKRRDILGFREKERQKLQNSHRFCGRLGTTIRVFEYITSVVEIQN